MSILASTPAQRIKSGDRVCIIGGGPAGSFTALHVLQMAKEQGIQLEVLIFEARHFSVAGAGSCKGCAGILSSRLLTELELLGITLPEDLIQSELDSYAATIDGETLHIKRSEQKIRIVSIYRGCGPRHSPIGAVSSFDEFLLSQACARGARHIAAYVRQVRKAERPIVCTDRGEWTADLLVVANGVNHKSPLSSSFRYRPPKVEIMAQDEVQRPPDWPEKQVSVFFQQPVGLVFGAVVPKGKYLNISLLGTHLTRKTIPNFIKAHRDELEQLDATRGLCGCTPRVATTAAPRYYGDRWVIVGDAAVTRLYKDGIGSACYTARVAVHTALKYGVSAAAFRKHYQPVVRSITKDNLYGKLLLFLWAITLKTPWLLNAWKNVIRCEAEWPPDRQVHTRMLWGVLTGDEPYRDLLKLLMSRSAFKCVFTRKKSKRIKMMG